MINMTIVSSASNYMPHFFEYVYIYIQNSTNSNTYIELDVVVSLIGVVANFPSQCERKLWPWLLVIIGYFNGINNL